MNTQIANSLAGICSGLVLLILAHAKPAEAMDLVVDNNADSGNGSLRQAIAFNASLGGGNTILFSNATSPIVLTSGELLIDHDLNIMGPGAKLLTVHGNSASRVFRITNNVTVNISDLTIANGRSDIGAGVRQHSGTLNFSNCAISGCYAVSTAVGGGVYQDGGSLALVNCAISGNSAINYGGGIYQNAGALFLTNSTISGNFIYYHYGGGIYLNAGASFLANCTICSNSAPYYGGGIYNVAAAATIRNTIIAGNHASYRGPDCLGSFTSAGYNLISAANDSTGWGALDQKGTTNSPLNPLLSPLQDNGGPTPTLAPLPGSPAIDQGNSGGILSDQRGRPRPYINSSIISIPFGGDRSDIGAVEISPVTLVVSNANDTGAGSLRQAVADTSPSEVDTIAFASNVVGAIVLTNSYLAISNSVNILGPGAKKLAVSGNNAHSVIRILGGNVLLSGLTITGGRSSGFGAGIFNNSGAALTISNSFITGSTSLPGGIIPPRGAGIANYGNLTVWNTTIASNNIEGSGPTSGGAGLMVNDGTAQLINCTVARNAVSINGVGGAVYAAWGSLSLSNCTVAGNSSMAGGGGIYADVTVSLVNSIVAGNTNNGASSDVLGSFYSGGYNLIGDTNGSTGFGATGDQLDVNPLLGPLADHGGPTPTMALLSNSPAIDTGKSFGVTTDQRGAPRPFDFASLPDAAGGDGSDIGAFELVQPRLAIRRALGNKVVLAWPSYAGGFTLESKTNQTVTGNWATVPGTPVVVVDEFNVTNSAAGGGNFYRLHGN